ncbi:MAG: aminodeoxychorismate synthase component I [Sphingomicrobium sp.]
MPQPSPLDWLEIAKDPFVLLDFEGSQKLYRHPRELIEARDHADVLPALERLRGQDAFGFLAYEAGFALEPALDAPTSEPALPLLWFMTGCRCEQPPPLPDPNSAWAGAPAPAIDRAAYRAALRDIHERILEGDLYQANFTFAAEVRTQGHPLALFAQLRERAQGRWSAIVHTGSHWILSFSPELFFTCDAGLVTCRPMKGTAASGSDAESLQNDPKQRAENLMIVDLIRNDLSRVAAPGGVQVPELFTVETFPTLLQMTSTVTARLRSGQSAIDVLRAIFPCGSITGAPKINAMQILSDLESAPRGIYTGSIGALSADGNGAFNVAIRTLVLPAESNIAHMGLGSGIVADSLPEDEWDECKRKGAFVATPVAFTLIETMRVDAVGTLPDLKAHLDRLGRSAADFGFAFDRTAVEADLLRRTDGQGPGRLRLELAHDGSWLTQMSEIPQSPEIADIAICRHAVFPEDYRLRHKTSDRDFYDAPRRASGAFEILFTDHDGYLTEGSFTNLFVQRDGRLITPPIGRGLLPGILRQSLLNSGEAVEDDLRAEDLAAHFYIGNAVRGLIRGRLRS